MVDKFMASRLLRMPVLVWAVWSAFGQAHVTPTFEVASVKPADPAAAISMNRSGNRFTTSNTSLEMLVLWAYDIRNDRLFGKPKWLDSVRYDVVAKAPEETPVVGLLPQLRQMMQSLLAARFKLAVHRETRELPMYVMVVGKNGPKVHLTEAVEGPVSAPNPFSMTSERRLSGTKVSTSMLAKVLSDQLGNAVEDQTGLKGVFDFTLEWAPDTDAQFIGASLFTAIQEQLGLKLESRKGPVEVLVIDHIEGTPTEN
jgi:uncharacterized protein (TIGR03435 family)